MNCLLQPINKIDSAVQENIMNSKNENNFRSSFHLGSFEWSRNVKDCHAVAFIHRFKVTLC